MVNMEFLCQLYQDGLSSGEVAKEVGMRPRKVRKVLERAGIMRSRSEGQKLRYERHPERRIVGPTGFHTKTEFKSGHISPNRGRAIHTEKSKKLIGGATRELYEKEPWRREELTKKAKEMWGPGGPLRLAYEQGKMAISEEGLRELLRKVHLCPNKREIELEEVLEKLFPGQWKYVGGGEVVIGGKCPDFINVNGRKQIIELFGEPWHKADNSEERISHFGRYGYSTLIVWVKELKSKQNRTQLKEKLLSFGNKT